MIPLIGLRVGRSACMFVCPHACDKQNRDPHMGSSIALQEVKNSTGNC